MINMLKNITVKEFSYFKLKVVFFDSNENLEEQVLNFYATNPIKKRKCMMNYSELYIFQRLVEMYTEIYYVLPQVHISELIDTYYDKTIDKDKKRVLYYLLAPMRVDFVLVDKITYEPQIIIEVDGDSHKTPWQTKKDKSRKILFDRLGIPLKRILLSEIFSKNESVKSLLKGNKENVNMETRWVRDQRILKEYIEGE